MRPWGPFHRTSISPLLCRDAWKAEWDAGTRKEKAWTDYVSKLLAVRNPVLSPAAAVLIIPRSQILKGVDTEDTKKWVAEIESAS